MSDAPKREAFEPRHAVTYQTTKEGERIAADQIVTAEADMRPKAETASVVDKAPEPVDPIASEAPASPSSPRRRGSLGEQE